VPISVPPGALDAQLVVEVGLSADQVSEPLSLAPDAWFGIAPRWTVGVTHSDLSVDRIEAGASVCIRHGELDCDRMYHGGALDVRYAVLDWLAPRARFIVRDVSPWKPALTLGALARWEHGRFAITGDPYLQLGLANTDRGNRHQLFLPVELAVQPTCGWELAVDTGWNSELATWTDGWKVPLAVATRVQVMPELELGALFGYTTLVGPRNTSQERVLFVTVRFTPTLR
jgi:hypothetical protein